MKLGHDVVQAISDLKPYRNGNKYLRGLHDINNMDKHKIVCPVAAFLSARPNNVRVEYEIRKLLDGMGLPDEPIEPFDIIGMAPVGINIGDVLRTGPGEPMPWEEFSFDKSKLIPKLPIDLPKNVDLGGMYISEVGKHLLDVTTHIIDLFRRQFG